MKLDEVLEWKKRILDMPEDYIQIIYDDEWNVVGVKKWFPDTPIPLVDFLIKLKESNRISEEVFQKKLGTFKQSLNKLIFIGENGHKIALN